MNIQGALRAHLAETGLSQRALALSAGLHEKAVSNILTIPGFRPRHSTLTRLSSSTGLDFVALAAFPARTYSDVLDELEARRTLTDNPAALGRQLNRLRWLIRKAGWVAQTRVVCRADVIDFFADRTPAALGLTPGSFGTYKSDILAALREDGVRARARSIMDVGGIWSELHEAIKESDLPRDLKLASGAFLVYLADACLSPEEVTRATLSDYYAHRLATGTTTEAAARKHVKRIAHLVTRLAQAPAFAPFGCRPVDHPFADARDKFGVAEAEIALLLQDWDRRVVPWALGLASRDGQSREAFIQSLDEKETEETPAQQRRRARRAARQSRRSDEPKPSSSGRDELLRQAGFLTRKDRWSDKTAGVRRGYVISLAKAYVAATDERIETIEELTDPEVLEEAIEALADANDEGEFDSSYLESVLKTMTKVACGFAGRSEEDIEVYHDLRKEFGSARRGIAPRNKAKLRQFTPERIQMMLDLTDRIVTDVNVVVARRRRAHRQRHGVLPKAAEVYTPDLVRDVMAALAHAIMLKRGPRSANLIGLRLDWIRWQNELATIVIPAVAVKMRGKGDPDLTVPLGPAASRLLRSYVDNIRAVALREDDKANPYLFPAQAGATMDQPYRSVLQRLVKRVHAVVGVRINPHLYRHLIGWIWLRDSLDNLPKVQRLLGHTSLQTTIDHYAEIDEELALDEWQRRLNERAA